jgi:hypothetical protein
MNDPLSHDPVENQQDRILARLRSYGPAFDFELVAECCVHDPDARITELCTAGYHIETLRVYRLLQERGRAWSRLYVMRGLHKESGTIIPAPWPLGVGRVLERWTA